MKKLDFKKAIEPFVWKQRGGMNSISLDFEVDDILEEEFNDTFNPENLTALAHIFLQQQPTLSGIIEISDDASDSHNFYASSEDEEALKKFILGFRTTLD